MPKVLTPAQIAQFQRDGYVHPIRVMSAAQAATLRARLEAFEAASGGPRVATGSLSMHRVRAGFPRRFDTPASTAR